MCNMDRHWKNQLIFPLIIASSLLYAVILRNVIFLFIFGYFLLMICYKKQATLLLLSFFVAFLFLINFYGRINDTPIENQAITIAIEIYPDTIKVNDRFVTFEGKTNQGVIYVQYITQSDSEAQQWTSRKNWQKIIQTQGFFKESLTARNEHAFNRRWFEFSNHKNGTFQIEKVIAQKEAKKFFSVRKIRAYSVDWVENVFYGKVATYIKALLLGYRDGEFNEIREAYTSSGILHLFSISGMHIAIFFGWFFYLFRRSLLTFEEFSGPFILLMFFSVALFGQGLSIWRGMLMYLIQFLFKENNIHWSALDRFALMLFLLLLIDPKSFIQTSGVLSILLSLIILLSQEYQKNAFVFSLEVSFLASPILMFFFFEVPLLGGILTVLIAPLFSYLLLPGLVCLCLLAFVSFPLDSIISGINQGLEKFEQLLDFSSHFVVITGKIKITGIVILLVIGLLAYQSKRLKKTFFLLFLIFLLLPRFPLYTAVSFVDVGQGDSIVIQSFGNQEVYVIDTGGKIDFFDSSQEKKNRKANASYTLLPFLKGEGIREIDGLFLTHGDYDHAGDLGVLLQQFKVNKIYLAKGMLQHNIMVNLDVTLLKNTRVIELENGDVIGNKIRFDVLAPTRVGKGKNEDSLVLQTEIKGLQFLFMGDLEAQGELELLRNYPNLSTDIIKLGHHGSRTSSTEGFIQKINAKHGIISCGVANHFKHPHPEVLQTLEKYGLRIFRTDQDGMIRYIWRRQDKYPKIKRLLVNPDTS